MSRLPRRSKLVLLAALALLVVGLLAGEAFGRVGGGDVFGGGGSSGGGGGGGDDGLVIWLVYLAIRYPHIGVPLLLGYIGYRVVKGRRDKRRAPPATSQQSLARMRSGAAAQRRARVQEQIDTLLQDDPNFSEVLFLDFAQMIFTRFEQNRGQQVSQGLAPYLSEDLRQRLGRMGGQLGTGLRVEDVVVGSMRLDSVTELGERWHLACQVEANYTEVIKPEADGEERREAYFARCRLGFQRNKGVLSKGPQQIRSLGCPSCGSPIKLDAENVCAYCGKPALPGLFHWEMKRFDELVRLHRRDMPLDLGGAELGTDFPTLVDPDLSVKVKDFKLRYPDEGLERLKQRAREVFLALQQAWTENAWEKARGFETDRLYQMHLFWMERYRDKGLRNVLEQIQVESVELAKLGRDAFFESATLRIRASMIDYTVDAQGELRAGSKSKRRRFSEYWTFIRRSGFDSSKQTGTGECPSCGAPIKVAMSGQCEYCGASLSSGEFDWTLAQIEQDESYAG